MRSESITIDGVVYEVRELSMRQIMPMMEGDQAKMAQLMIAAAVHVNGVPIGDAALDLGFGSYRKLMDVVNRVHGLDDEGNAP